MRSTRIQGQIAAQVALGAKLVNRVLLVALVMAAVRLPAQELTTAAQVHGLSPEAAGRRLPVKLRGVVTSYDERLYARFIQDETSGIYLRQSSNTPLLNVGDLVEVEGTTSPGEYAPVIKPERVRVVGRMPLPAARQTTFDQLASGAEDSQFVEVTGIVRSVRFEMASQYHAIVLATGGGRLTVYARKLPVANTGDLVDATVRVRGVCSTLFNRQRQLFDIRVLAPRAEDLVIEKPAATDPFAVALQPIGSLLQFAPQGSYGHRVKLTGTVTYHQPGVALYLQDANHGLRAESAQPTVVQPGDRVEILGFTAQGKYTPIIEDTVYRKLGSGTPPTPENVSLDDALSGSYDCRLIRIEAKLLDRARQGSEQFLVLESGKFIFHARLGPVESPDAFRHVSNGSRLAVTGICQIEPGAWQASDSWRAESFQLLLRAAADVVVLRSPPWWTLQKLLWMTAFLALGVLAAFAWVAVLRRRVQKQTGIIRRQLQVEASLKERYLDLFENANDVVFTHDLSARLTSVNRTGEMLLQRGRADLLGLQLLDLVAEDQRPAAQQWLDQVVGGMELPPAEWDFVNATGQRVKLEISSRLINENAKPAEVEGIARDITERRRLERELLEISNRQHRRMGHDLHDGVCQQLAGIAYLVNIMGDQMQEQGSPQAEEADKIADMINEVTMQVRSVARGLFPVRLEENGLLFSLEELAANVANRFRGICEFTCDSPPTAVDNEAALHLYYIAQEAVLNAFNHGTASHVSISLKPDGVQFNLTVRDDGIGFDPASIKSGGMGIRIMRYRAIVIGATLVVKSQPGRGTEVTCMFFPIRREPMREAING